MFMLLGIISSLFLKVKKDLLPQMVENAEESAALIAHNVYSRHIRVEKRNLINLHSMVQWYA